MRRLKEDSHDFINLASSITQAQASDIKYICKDCGPEQILLDYPQAQYYNRFAGKSYICPNCSKIYDSSLEKLPKAAKGIKSSVNADNTTTMPFLETIAENKGIERVDEYAEINQRFEPMEDENIRRMGGTIIDSRIGLTDSQGRNRTIVRRDASTIPPHEY